MPRRVVARCDEGAHRQYSTEDQCSPGGMPGPANGVARAMRERLPVTLGDLGQAVGGRVVAGAAETLIDGFSIDSRSLSRGDLFFAIRGDRFDGHAYVADAIERGACGAVVCDAAALGSSPAIGVVVDDTVAGPAGVGPVHPPRLEHSGRCDHWQCGQDHDQGADRGAAGSAIPRVPEPRQPEQPHRVAALAAGAADAARGRGGGVRYERTRGDQPTGRDRRAGAAGLDERCRSAHRILSLDRRDRRREGGNPGRRDVGHRRRRQRGR